MRQILNFNTDWQYLACDEEKMKDINYSNSEVEDISIPHSNKLVPHHYFNHNEYEFVSWYRRPFYLDEKFKDQKIIVKFDGVMKKADVFVNGQLVGSHKGGYTSFKFDITDYVKFEENNLIAVKVDSRCRTDIPPEGNKVDYLLFGGIYRRVQMIVTGKVNIDWTFFEIDKCSEQKAVLKPQFKILNSKQAGNYSLQIEFTKEGQLVKKTKYDINLNKNENELVLDNIVISDPKLWYPDNPELYTVNTKLLDEEENVLDSYQANLGIRKVEFKDDGLFYINDEKLKLRGLNRHQLYPYVGNAMPDKGQEKDAEFLKEELGLNFVRSSHYPADPAFLDRCDEIGLLVFEEIPGWQHIGGEDWKEVAVQNLKEMIIRDRNHPSIFIWGVRINESQDDHQFYKKTNQIAHQLDSSRPTGGVRNFRDSEFLEDVFTYNDFEGNLEGEIKEPHYKPYMICEYMGHMYPTKSYDSVERQIKHAVKHMKIQDKQYQDENIAGASGWCAFDYNTHADFGSGDRICYHGVCDMFRTKKMAAFGYESQQNPSNKPVIHIARYLTPSFNEDYGDKIIVFSNCDQVKLFVNDKLEKTAEPASDKYPGLPHPPFVFEDCKWWEWGASTIESLKAVGFIEEKEVCEHTIYPFTEPEKIILKADHSELKADGSDLTRLEIRLVDKNEQTLILAHNPIFFKLEGPAEIVGETPLSLEGGRGAVYIKSKREPGVIKIKAKSPHYESEVIEIESKELKEKIVPVTN